MADDLNTQSTAPESASTPVSGEPVEKVVQSEEQKTPDISSDPWDFGTDKDEKKDEKPAEPAKAAEPVKEEKKDEKKDESTEEKPLEDQVLEELFNPEKAKEVADKAASDATSKEEEIDKLGSADAAKLQENAAGRAWAERVGKVYDPLKDFKYNGAKPEVLKETLTSFLGPEKAAEYSQFEAHHLVDTNPDAAFQRAYAVKMLAKDPSWKFDPATIPSLDDLVAGKLVPGTADASTEAKGTTTGSDIPTDLKEITKALDESTDITWDWRDPANDDQFVDDRERAMVKTIRGLEAEAIAGAKAKAEKSELTEQIKNLTETVNSIKKNTETETQTAFKNDLKTGVQDFRNSIETKLLPHIIKSTGLEVSKDDTPEVTAFKQRKSELYTGDAYEKANGFASRFETFAYNESKVKQDLNELANKVVETKAEALKASKSGNTAEVTRLDAELAEFRIPTIQLLAAANEEFKAKFVDPDIQLMGLKAKKIAEPILEAEKRIETVANGGGIPASKKPAKEYRTANDVWGNMDKEAEEDERLRSAA